MYKTVVPELEKIPEVVECHFTTGPYTMLCKLYARDNEHLMTLLNDQIQQIPGVVETETLISLEQSTPCCLNAYADMLCGKMSKCVILYDGYMFDFVC